jgi:AcrR family transcriptional regulator
LSTPDAAVAAPLGRPPRADAVRNRERVLTAARELFARDGRQVQMEGVARHAGVGVGTVYRHFPTKEALVDAVATRRWEEILAYMESECAPLPDPGEAVARVLRHAGEVQERDLAFCDCVEEMTGGNGHAGEAFARVDALMGELVTRGREAGVLRADLTNERMGGVFCGLAAVVRSGQDWRPYVEIVIDGLRAR